ncbi:MAG: type II toxin-antitoxin system YoeB family toxin [Bacteroidetes bacterium]|nr:type II toxin-antitoxin system YoeB family toxin [Bacteroidota bacterium]
MKLLFSKNTWSDYLFWQKTDKKIVLLHGVLRWSISA